MSNYRRVGMIKDSERKTFLSNPVNAFILIRMLTVDLNEKIPKISSQRDQESGEKIFERELTPLLSWPARKSL